MKKKIPILFSTEMVQAILAGTKTETRRLVKFPVYAPWVKHKQYADWKVFDLSIHDGEGNLEGKFVPKWQPGDILWVRETFAGDDLCGFVYKADHPDADLKAGDLDDGDVSIRCWKPSIHMPRIACRIELEVISRHIERLQDITEPDARAEGVKLLSGHDVDHLSYEDGPISEEEKSTCPLYIDYQDPEMVHVWPSDSYKSLWDSINGKPRYMKCHIGNEGGQPVFKKVKLPDVSWEANPYVWVIKFKRI